MYFKMEEHIVNGLHETLRTQLIVEQQPQHLQSTHYGHGYYQHPHHQLARNHTYDPNMCTTAARFSDSFYNKTIKVAVDTKSSTTLQPPPTTASHTEHSEEELLDYNNAILMHETAHEIGAEAIVANCDALEKVPTPTELPTHAMKRTELHIPEEVFVPSSYQYMHFEHTVLSHETVGAQTQVPGLLIHRSPNEHLCQQNYLVNAEHRTDKENAEYVELQTQQIDVSNMFAVHVAAETQSDGVHLQSFSLATQYDSFQPSENVEDDNSVEIIARYAADLAGVPAVPEPYETPIERHLDLTSKDEQRLLLESTMSPLLAAVNDITKRDAELQLFLNQSIEKESSHYLATLSTTEAKKDSLHNSSDEDDYLLVTDKAVECRAKASLPTNYLYFGDVENSTNEPSVFAKKSIPRRTMFGPYEGHAVFVSDIDLDVLHVQTARCYPVLMLDENHILDVSNEETSNWMRYIRLAETYSQQNLQLMLENSKIYLRCVRDVRPEEELRVGYHSSYAIRFVLSTLQPTAADMEAGDYQTQMKTHLKEHDSGELAEEDKMEMNELPAEEQKRPQTVGKRKHNRKLSKAKIIKRRSTAASKCTLICRFCRKGFATNEILIQHITKNHKSSKERDSEYKFKCNLCAKRFHKESLFTKHKETHADTLSKPYKCSVCHQQCSTPAALTAHLNGHEFTQYCCVFCEQKFKYVREFKKHVQKHKIDDYFECIHCKKHYDHYHLVRKHVRIFHSSREAVCYICGKKFQNLNALQRHRLTHSPHKKHACTTCGKQFGRRDHLATHTKRKHSSNNDAMKSNDGMAIKTLPTLGENLPVRANSNDESVKKLSEESVDDGSQYLKMSPLKPPHPPATTATHNYTISSSSSNRRKQTPMKLKALELNAETVTFVALSELLSPFLISETTLNEDYTKSTDKDRKNPDTVPEPILSKSISEQSTCSDVLHTRNKDEDYKDHVKCSDTQEVSLSAKATNPLFPFNCYICTNTSFKRRGMLVNHMAKMHPTVDVDHIAVLNAPIVRQQLIYPCPYCSNVYKLNAKRKAHIIKHHPGQELPAPMRQNRAQAVEMAQSPNDVATKKPPSTAEVVAAVGTMAVSVHKCDRCHKQYAARSRLLNHYHNAHPDHVIPPRKVQSPQLDKSAYKCRSNLFDDEQRLDDPQPASLEPKINIIPYHLQPAPVSPENKLLKLSSAATLELSRFDDDFFSERVRGSNEDVVGSHVFADHSTHADLQHLSALFEEPSISGIDANMEKYNRSIEAQFFEKITKFS